MKLNFFLFFLFLQFFLLLFLFVFLSLNIRQTDVLTIFDGHDVTSHVIVQYLGSKERFRVVSGGSEVTIQFQTDPDDSSFIMSQGFLIHYRGKGTQNASSGYLEMKLVLVRMHLWQKRNLF